MPHLSYINRQEQAKPQGEGSAITAGAASQDKKSAWLAGKGQLATI